MEFLLDGERCALFTTFVLSNSTYSAGSFDKINRELAGDPTVPGELLKSEKCFALFLSDLSERLDRILAWLRSLKRSVPPSVSESPPFSDIIHGFADHLVIPLLHPKNSDLHASRGFAELLIITTALSYACLKQRQTHKVLLGQISKSPHLMRSILPSINGAELIQAILTEAEARAEIRVFPSAATLAEWTMVAAELCSECPGSHGVRVELARWTSLVELRDSFSAIQDQLHAQENPVEDEKGRTKQKLVSDYLSPRDRDNLGVFGMGTPTGIGPLDGVLASLRERESFYLFHAFVNTFPCALCLRRDNAAGGVSFPPNRPNQDDKTTETAQSQKPLSQDALPDSFNKVILGHRLGHWKVCLSEHAFKDLLLANKEGYLNAIARRIKELATGQWEPSSLRLPLSQKMREQCGANMRIPLWRATYGRDGRILWQVNLGYDAEVGHEFDYQIITVWRIGRADEIRGSISQVLHVQKTYTIEHVERCCVRLQQFPLHPTKYLHTSSINQLAPSGGEVAHAAQGHLNRNRYYSMTEKVLDRLSSAPDNMEFPFELSREELKIVEQKNSAAFILGRSGTGKTTCMLFKLLWRNIASRENETPVRQIFLTRSGFLAERLRDYLRRLIEFQMGKASARTGSQHQAPQGYMLKEAKDPLGDETLDTLEDDKFPLVCTFDQLFGFLERVIKLHDRKNFEFLMGYKPGNTPWEGRVKRLINYNVFSSPLYWGKRYQDHRGKYGLEPDLVFAEILGIIKGSTSLRQDLKPLSLEEYLRLSERQAPVFTSPDIRNKVYTEYEAYERKKRKLGHRDDIDRVTHLLKSLDEQPQLKERIQTLFDEVYVDEVQDNKLLEIDLLFTLIKNPHGLCFAGDTAQCISRDSTFRFEDIKGRFHNHFSTIVKGAQARYSQLTSTESKLAKNYRSHQEILSLAADIVEMLCNGFPTQIDKLPREIGEKSGVKPTIFLGFDYKILPQGETEVPGAKQAISDFGAGQVIIVKDDDAKDKLKKVFASTILTVYQSKGLEFEDVVLYNFFSNPIWNTVHLPILQLLLTRDAEEKLDKLKYGGLCSELKHLYVAITRARRNLWIVESSSSSVEGIVELWARAQNREPLVSLVYHNGKEADKKARTIIQAGKSNSTEGWRTQGEMFLQRALYEDALVSFRKANYKQGVDLAQAYILYEEASLLDVGESSEGTAQAKKIFAEAARLFEKASFIQKAAETWAAAGKYKEAAAALKAEGEYDKAALWYARASDFMEAAECHHLAKQYEEAVGAYHKGVHFADLVAYLGKYRKCISNSIKTRYSRLINLLFQHGNLPETLLPAAVEAFGSENEIEAFYKKFERTQDLMAFYRERKRYSDFFKLALSEGKFEGAILIAKESRAVDASQGECASSVPVGDLLSLFNGLMAGYTWSSIQFDFHHVSFVRDHPIVVLGKGTEVGSELHGPSSGWDKIFDCLRAANVGDFKIPREWHNTEFFTEFGNGFLDLVEFLRLDTFLNGTSQKTYMSQLPVATMQKFTTIAGQLLSKKAPLPTSLITSIGGVVISHLEDQVMILRWSPLFPTVSNENTSTAHKQNCGHVILTREQAYDAFTEWLITIVTRIIPCALLSLVETQPLCFLALQGSCQSPNNSVCKPRRHTGLSPKELRADIVALLNGVMSCAIARLYHSCKLKTLEPELHIANRHLLLIRLLKELTFISPLLNDSEMQKEIWQEILAKNGKWFHIRDDLVLLIFHPVQPMELGTVSTLLEESGIADQLGVMPQFLEFLWNHCQDRPGERWKFDFIKSCNELNPTRIAHYDTSTLVNRIESIIETISRQPCRELQSFHSVLSLYESLSLELINRTHSVDLLVPQSRLHFIRDLTQTPYPTSDDRHKLERCLVQLLGSLCDILEPFSTIYERNGAKTKYEKQSSFDPDILFQVCGKVLWDGDKYIVRRSLDHLTLCMINMGIGGITCLPAGYHELGKKIHRAYQHWNFLNPPTLVNWDVSCDPNQTAIKLAGVYRTYSKEKLVIVNTPQNAGSSRFHSLTSSKIRRVVFSGLFGMTRMPEPSDEAIMASKIALWWRRCSTKLEARHAHEQKRADILSQEPECQAERMVDDILVDWMRSRDMRRGNIYILRDSGFLLLTSLLKLQRLVKMTHATAMNTLADSAGAFKLSVQAIVTHLEKRKKSLAKYRARFEDTKGVRLLFKLPTNKLQERMDKDLKALETYRKEVETWAREIEDCLADTWSETNAWTVWVRGGF